MMTHTLLLRCGLPLALLAGMSGVAHAITLTPQYAGTYLTGNGANSQWVQVTEDWRGATNGSEIWGTGIWGLQDHDSVMGLHMGDANVIQTFSGRVDQINFGDQRFINEWGSSWSTPQLAPIFNNMEGENQDNWASSFSGFLAITTPGAYNFGVLYDDGFRFSLIGAGGQTVSLVQDGLNPRDRLGFDEDLQLTSGLYAYQLDAYDRLEAGVVQLAWWTPGANLALVPKESLFTNPVPEPSMPLLMLIGLAMLGWRRFKHN
jgi:hypothetical protein